MRSIFAVAALLSQFCCVGAFVFPTIAATNHRSRIELSASTGDSDESTCTRRQAWIEASQVVGAAVFLGATPAFAMDTMDTLEADKRKLLKGYERLSYLLDNWEKETTNCKTQTQYSSASSPCERTPLNVQYYLGYRSTEDPLFKADKTMRRLEGLVPPGDEVDYLDAMEKFNEKVEEASGMSYVSSWGEANPGGGKDRVEYFVERAKTNAIDARDALGVILKILKLN